MRVTARRGLAQCTPEDRAELDINKERNRFIPKEMDRTGLPAGDVKACMSESLSADALALGQYALSDQSAHLPSAGGGGSGVGGVLDVAQGVSGVSKDGDLQVVSG